MFFFLFFVILELLKKGQNMIRMSESERKRIKESFRGKGVLLDLLLEKCVVSCASGNAVPAIYGFRLESPKKEEKLFYYVTYIKIPDLQYLYIGEELYGEYDRCLKRRKERVRYFPIYGFSSLNLI